MRTIQEDIINGLKEEISGYFAVSGAHDFSHTERVYNLALHIAGNEDADIEVVAFSALLHDIARKKEAEDETICHAKEGAIIANNILAKKKIASNKIQAITYSIGVHRYKQGTIPTTLEARILQDADRLDSLGALVIARTFAQDGAKGKPIYAPSVLPNKEYTGKSATGINHLYEKILQIRPERFYTTTAQKMAKRRYKFVELFVETFIREWKGEI